jgi:hypothetical protein
MRALREPGTDPEFVLKALGEAAGELRRALDGLPPKLMRRAGAPPDEDWSLVSIACHLRHTERGFARQVEAFFEAPGNARLEPVDLDDIPAVAETASADEEAVLDAFHQLRRRNTYMLWGLGDRDWRMTAEHPYLGPLTLADVAREMYRHDLEHLWQARRILESLGGSG